MTLLCELTSVEERLSHEDRVNELTTQIVNLEKGMCINIQMFLDLLPCLKRRGCPWRIQPCEVLGLCERTALLLCLAPILTVLGPNCFHTHAY